MIKSLLSQDVIDSIKESDLDVIRLKKTANKTGIYEILKKAGKSYFSLSPRWNDESKKEVVFWLNPMNQNKYKCGWFNVNDLKDWAKDKGKIIIK
jgi:ABC-type Zn uptake system ZnuABC Zn-binding protein ZnuA